MLRLIGLTGNAGSGKDTTADYLVNTKGWIKLAFAKPLKDICINYLGLTEDEAYTQEGKAKYNDFWGMTNREILQKIGTDAFRNGFHKDTWTKIMELQIVKLLNEGKNVVISDCRFDNEALLIEKLGGIVFKINRPNYDTFLLNKETSHISEQGIKNSLIAGIIDNNDTIKKLHLRFEDAIFTFNEQHKNLYNDISSLIKHEIIAKEFADKLMFNLKKFIKIYVKNIYIFEKNKIRIEWIDYHNYNFVLIINPFDNIMTLDVFNKDNNLKKQIKMDFYNDEHWILINKILSTGEGI
jgi:hypothetical protein